MTLFLVRHGRPRIDRARPAHEWELDPGRYDAVWALRQGGRLPTGAARFSSPEPKALQTAQLLTDRKVSVVEGLREHRRESTTWYDDHETLVRRAFAGPHCSLVPGWEPLWACSERVVAAVTGIREAHPDGDVVMVGHGTAWTLLMQTWLTNRPTSSGGPPSTCPTCSSSSLPEAEQRPSYRDGMSDPSTQYVTEESSRPPGRDWWDWWHESHPTFAALTGFFSGMVFVTAVPGGFAGVLRLLFSYDRAERLFPLVLVFFVLPLAMLYPRKTRRFAQFMWLGMLVTALVVLGVTSLVLYFMVRAD